MALLVLLCTAGILAFGYLIMHKLDQIRTGKPPALPAPGNSYRGVLAFGADELIPRLKEAGIRCQAATGPDLPDNASYSAVLAFSSDEWQNILLCRKARAKDSDILLLAKCNDPSNLSYYEDLAVDKIFMPGEPTEPIIKEMWGI